MRIICYAFVMAMAAFFAGTGAAWASEGGLPWGNFALRVLNAAIFVGIIWYAASGLIKKYFFGRREAIVKEMDDLARAKADALARLAEMEKRVAGVEAECEALLAEGRVQAERLKASILAEAEKQAAQILEQARRSAEQEGRAEWNAIRAQLAEEVVAAVEQGISGRLDQAAHQKLINKSLTKVVIQ